jgi:hypothetical protein
MWHRFARIPENSATDYPNFIQKQTRRGAFARPARERSSRGSGVASHAARTNQGWVRGGGSRRFWGAPTPFGRGATWTIGSRVGHTAREPSAQRQSTEPGPRAKRHPEMGACSPSPCESGPEENIPRGPRTASVAAEFRRVRSRKIRREDRGFAGVIARDRRHLWACVVGSAGAERT